MFVFPMFLNSKATFLDIMCIKISGGLPWVKNYQRLRNHHDKYAVKVLKENEVVGHVPRDISKYCTSALLYGGTKKFEITVKRQNKRGNGIEVPWWNVEKIIKDYLSRTTK